MNDVLTETRMTGTAGRETPWETVKCRFYQLARQFQVLGDSSRDANQRIWNVFQRVIDASLGELSRGTCEQVTAFLEEQIDWTEKNGEIPPLFRPKDGNRGTASPSRYRSKRRKTAPKNARESITARDRDRLWQKVCSYSREELELLQDFNDTLPGTPLVVLTSQLVELRLEQLDRLLEQFNKVTDDGC